MKLIIIPALFSLAYIAFENRDKIADQYEAAYPQDRAKSTALAECLARNPNLNRLDADDRKRCYRRTFGGDATVMELRPKASPAYDYSPSHLPGNDIRRQQANDEYLQPETIRNAAARQTLVVPGAFTPVPDQHAPAMSLKSRPAGTRLYHHASHPARSW